MITVRKLKKMLEEWDDNSPISIFLMEKGSKLGKFAGGTITSVDFQVERGKKAPYIMICGQLDDHDFGDAS